MGYYQWRSQTIGDGGADSANMHTPQNARQCELMTIQKAIDPVVG